MPDWASLWFTRVTGFIAFISIVTGYTTHAGTPLRFSVCIIMMIFWAHAEYEEYKQKKSDRDERNPKG